MKEKVLRKLDGERAQELSALDQPSRKTSELARIIKQGAELGGARSVCVLDTCVSSEFQYDRPGSLLGVSC